MINTHKLGLVFGTFLGTCHLIWAWLVLSGFAQVVVNWIFRLHFIEPPYAVLPFNLGVAGALVLITSLIGYISGWVLGAIWNWLRADGAAQQSISAKRTRHAVP